MEPVVRDRHVFGRIGILIEREVLGGFGDEHVGADEADQDERHREMRQEAAVLGRVGSEEAEERSDRMGARRLGAAGNGAHDHHERRAEQQRRDREADDGEPVVIPRGTFLRELVADRPAAGDRGDIGRMQARDEIREQRDEYGRRGDGGNLDLGCEPRTVGDAPGKQRADGDDQAVEDADRTCDRIVRLGGEALAAERQPGRKRARDDHDHVIEIVRRLLRHHGLDVVVGFEALPAQTDARERNGDRNGDDQAEDDE